MVGSDDIGETIVITTSPCPPDGPVEAQKAERLRVLWHYPGVAGQRQAIPARSEGGLAE